jgi:hypothetical protein
MELASEGTKAAVTDGDPKPDRYLGLEIAWERGLSKTPCRLRAASQSLEGSMGFPWRSMAACWSLERAAKTLTCSSSLRKTGHALITLKLALKQSQRNSGLIALGSLPCAHRESNLETGNVLMRSSWSSNSWTDFAALLMVSGSFSRWTTETTTPETIPHRATRFC